MTHSTHPDGFNPAEILNKAADVIEERGWFQGAYADPHGGRGVCAVGAISLVVDQIPDAYNTWAETHPGMLAIDAVEDWLARKGDTRSVIEWNDSPVRTVTHVTAVLREAAKAAGGAS